MQNLVKYGIHFLIVSSLIMPAMAQSPARVKKIENLTGPLREECKKLEEELHAEYYNRLVKPAMDATSLLFEGVDRNRLKEITRKNTKKYLSGKAHIIERDLYIELNTLVANNIPKFTELLNQSKPKNIYMDGQGYFGRYSSQQHRGKFSNIHIQTEDGFSIIISPLDQTVGVAHVDKLPNLSLKSYIRKKKMPSECFSFLEPLNIFNHNETHEKLRHGDVRYSTYRLTLNDAKENRGVKLEEEGDSTVPSTSASPAPVDHQK